MVTLLFIIIRIFVILIVNLQERITIALKQEDAEASGRTVKDQAGFVCGTEA